VTDSVPETLENFYTLMWLSPWEDFTVWNISLNLWS